MIELIDIFVEPLQQNGFRYIITGSVASMAYGEPRLTNDIDLILDINIKDIAPLIQMFPESDYYLPPIEVIQTECMRTQRGHFNIIHQETMLKADVYLIGSDPLHQWAFENVCHLTINTSPLCIAPPEYVILRKLEFYREGGSEKHLRDIASIINESESTLNLAFLDQQIDFRNLSAAWSKSRQIANQDRNIDF